MRRRQRVGEESTAPIGALAELLARGLALERAALLVDDGDGLVPAATWGTVQLSRMQVGEQPADGPWSAPLPITASGRTVGLALLGTPGGGPLPPERRAL